MKPKTNRRVYGFAITLTLMVIAFQNMTVFEFKSLKIEKVDEDIRQDQARELLGTFYRGSFAQKLENHENLSYLIYQKVERSLPDPWRDGAPSFVRALIRESKDFEFDPVFFLAVIQTESGFNPKAKGLYGEMGLMQIKPSTAEWIAKLYKIPWKGDKSLFDPITNIQIGIRYFDHLRSEFAGTAYHYVPAYNMGPKNMKRLDRDIGSVEKNNTKLQTRIYAMRVMRNYSAIYKEMAIIWKAEKEKYAEASRPNKITR